MSARSPDDKFPLLLLGLLVGALLLLSLVFGVANGIASGLAGFLHEAGLSEKMAIEVYNTIRWTIVGVFLIGAGFVATQILS